jgi:putative FmdB family regulatory protein
MPLYEYTCQACRSEFELLVRGSEKPMCPECGGARLEKRFSVPAAHTGGRSSSLPVCDADSGPSCGPGFCRTGQCQFD